MKTEIQTEKQYEKSLAWLVEKAAVLEDMPRFTEERRKLVRTYDYVADQAQRYRWRDAADAKG